MKRMVALVAFALSANVGMVQAGGSPPVDFAFSRDIAANEGCSFPVNLTGTGKSSVIPLPGDRLIITSPNSKTVATNLDDPSKSVTLDVNGAGHLSIDPQGNLRLVATGRNLVQDPGLNIMVLISGRFEFVFDPNTGLLTDLVGNGQLLDICAMID